MHIMKVEDGRARHFDPDVYDALLHIEEQFERIAEKHSKGIE